MTDFNPRIDSTSRTRDHLRTESNPRAVASLAGHPLHAMLVHFPIAFFMATLATDVAYWRTTDMMWANFSAWLLAAGLVFGGLALLASLIDLIGSSRLRSIGAAWLQLIGTVIVLVLALLNSFVHSRDAYTSVVPDGLILSAVTVLVLLVTSWWGGALIYRYRVGVAN